MRNTPGILVENPDGKPTYDVLKVGGWIILKLIIEPSRQCTYNATLRRARETIVAVEKV
jgi:hypothetical protein